MSTFVLQLFIQRALTFLSNNVDLSRIYSPYNFAFHSHDLSLRIEAALYFKNPFDHLLNDSSGNNRWEASGDAVGRISNGAKNR